MRLLFSLFIALLITACGGGDNQLVNINNNGTSCDATEQKQIVLDNMYAWYLWNDLLPANVDISQFATAEDLLAYLTTFSPDDGSGNPIDRFSFINSADADAQFFGEGRFEGFGFSYRYVDTAGEDLRLTRVFTDSPADVAGLARGQRVLALNGESIADINASGGVSDVLDTTPVDFTMRRLDGSEYTVTIDQAIVTMLPIPQWRLIDQGAGLPPIGYLELASFISTADAEFGTVFAEFNANNVTDVIVDLRYNGGGLVSTANLLGDFLGGATGSGNVFSKTEFNADRAAANNSTEFFDQLGNSVNLSRLIVIASNGSASASELVINGLDSSTSNVAVAIVGDDTFGKPVGQVGLEFCEKILRPTAFQTLNGDDFGDYFDGLPADCYANDDLTVAVGADTDPNILAARTWLSSGACPVASAPGGQFKTAPAADLPQPEHRGRAERVYAGAY